MIYRDFQTGEERQITIQRGQVVVVARHAGETEITREEATPPSREERERWKALYRAANLVHAGGCSDD